MRKIAISANMSFHLSPRATKRLAELLGKPCYFMKYSYSDDPDTMFEVLPDEFDELANKHFWMATDFPRINHNNMMDHQLGFDRMERDNPLLIQVIEELGDKAGAIGRPIIIYEIPDDVKWHIESNDCGDEWIAEDHRTWP